MTSREVAVTISPRSEDQPPSVTIRIPQDHEGSMVCHTTTFYDKITDSLPLATIALAVTCVRILSFRLTKTSSSHFLTDPFFY